MKLAFVLLAFLALYVNVESQLFGEGHDRQKRAVTEVNWRKAGNVSSARSSGNDCDASYSMTAIDAIQSHVSIINPKIGRIELSVQQAIDCSTAAGNNKCTTGSVEFVYKYFQGLGKPVATSVSYPYINKANPTCNYDKATPSKAKLIGFEKVKPDEDSLGAALQIGPVAVFIDGDNNDFLNYKSGTRYAPATCATTVDKANQWVLLVAAGTDAIGPFWMFKNTFGETWGDAGFFKMDRDGKNLCCIACNAIYPKLDVSLLK